MVIILGVLLIVGFIVLIGTIAYRVVSLDKRDAAPELAGEGPFPASSAAPLPTVPADIFVPLPEGARIVDSSLQGPRVMVRLAYEGSERQEILVIDLPTGRVLTTLHLGRAGTALP